MERKQIANVIVPAAAVAALIALAALVIVVGGADETQAKKDKGDTTVPVAATASAAGMSESLPPTDGPGWREVGEGLRVYDVTEGQGDAVLPGTSVTAHYTGWLTDGTVFDSSVRRGSPTQFSLKQVVRGWALGIPGMKPGGIRRLYIPSDLGYGRRGKGDIPPDATLIFEVKLISSP